MTYINNLFKCQRNDLWRLFGDIYPKNRERGTETNRQKMTRRICLVFPRFWGLDYRPSAQEMQGLLQAEVGTRHFYEGKGGDFDVNQLTRMWTCRYSNDRKAILTKLTVGAISNPPRPPLTNWWRFALRPLGGRPPGGKRFNICCGRIPPALTHLNTGRTK